MLEGIELLRMRTIKGHETPGTEGGHAVAPVMFKRFSEEEHRARDYEITLSDDGSFIVHHRYRRKKGKPHKVTMSSPRGVHPDRHTLKCDCGHPEQNGFPCRHVLAVHYFLNEKPDQFQLFPQYWHRNYLFTTEVRIDFAVCLSYAD